MSRLSTVLAHTLLDGRAMRTHALLSLVVLAGCSSLTSDKLKTSGITAHLQVTAKADGHSDATATLNVGNSLVEFVELSSGDTLTASSGGDVKTLTKTKLLGIVTYGATFTGHTAGGTQYGFDLQRASDTSAPSSTCTLPPGFEVTAPSGTHSRVTDDLTIGVAGAQTQLWWSAEGSCIRAASANGAVTAGSLVIPHGSLQANVSDGGVGTSCSVTVKLSDSQTGTLDSAYGGGSISCVQEREVVITSAP